MRWIMDMQLPWVCLGFAEKYNYILVNDTIENSVERLESVIVAEKCRIERKYGYIEEVFKN